MSRSLTTHHPVCTTRRSNLPPSFLDRSLLQPARHRPSQVTTAAPPVSKHYSLSWFSLAVPVCPACSHTSHFSKPTGNATTGCCSTLPGLGKPFLRQGVTVCACVCFDSAPANDFFDCMKFLICPFPFSPSCLLHHYHHHLNHLHHHHNNNNNNNNNNNYNYNYNNLTCPTNDVAM